MVCFPGKLGGFQVGPLSGSISIWILPCRPPYVGACSIMHATIVFATLEAGSVVQISLPPLGKHVGGLPLSRASQRPPMQPHSGDSTMPCPMTNASKDSASWQRPILMLGSPPPQRLPASHGMILLHAMDMHRHLCSSSYNRASKPSKCTEICFKACWDCELGICIVTCGGCHVQPGKSAN